MDTTAIQSQSCNDPRTSHSPTGLVNSSQATPTTTSSNRSTSPLSPSIATQSPSSPILLQAQDADPINKRTYNEPQSTVEDSIDDEDLALPHSETSQTDCNRGSTAIGATSCRTLPHLSGGRELSPSLQESSPPQTPSRSPSFEQRTQSLTRSMSDMTPKNRIEPSPRSGIVFIQNGDPDLHHGWTRKRPRPQTGRGIEVGERRDNTPVLAPLVSDLRTAEWRGSTSCSRRT